MTCPCVILTVLLTAYVTSAITIFEECRWEEKLGCLSYQNFGEWWTSSYWKFRHKRVNQLLKELWMGVASTQASPLCFSVVKSVLLLTHSNALELVCEAGKFRAWVPFWQRSCGVQGATRLQRKLITVLPAAEALPLKQSTHPASYVGEF